MPEPPAGRHDLSGLTLRSMRPADAGELSAFLTRVMDRDGEPDPVAGAWARELLRGEHAHPTSRPNDGTVIVDDASGRIVSCCFLIRQTWTYAGIPFGVGRPELIATEPAFRGRGLVRAQLTDIHARSEAFGHRMLAITGIPYFYRQFGYEPALITAGGRRGDVANVPPLPDSGTEPLRTRPVAEADLPFVARLYAQAAVRSLLAAVRDESIWRHELHRDPGSDYWHELRVIESPAGEPLGMLAYLPELRDGTLCCTLFEVIDGESWEHVTPAVLRMLRAAGEQMALRDSARFASISFDWTPNHPALEAAGGFFGQPEPPFAWYIRFADLPGFVHLIAPALERRLVASAQAGFSGELAIACYPNDLLHLSFDGGRLTAAEIRPLHAAIRPDAGFPGLTFLQLLLGSRSLAELEHAFPGEAWARDNAARLLLGTFFPKQASVVWPVA